MKLRCAMIAIWLGLSTSACAALPPIVALAFTPDGKSVLAGSQAGVEQRSWPELRLLRSLPTKLSQVHDIAFSPDGKFLALAGGDPAEKGSLELFHWPDATLLHRVHPHRDVIYNVAWRSDSTALVTASGDRTACLLDASSAKTKRVLEGHSRPVLTALFLPGDDKVVTAGVDETLRVWDTASGRGDRLLSNHTRPVNGLALRPAHERSAPPMLASVSSDRTVRLWQPTLGRMVRFARLPSEPRALAWTADGGSILVVGKDGSLRVVDPDAVEVRAAIPAVDGVAYSLAVAPDGSVLVGGANGQLRRVQLSGALLRKRGGR